MDLYEWIADAVMVAIVAPLLVLGLRSMQAAARDTHTNSLEIKAAREEMRWMADQVDRNRSSILAFEDRCNVLRAQCPIAQVGPTVERQAERIAAVIEMQNRDREDLRNHMKQNSAQHQRIFELLEKILMGVNGGVGRKG